MLTYVVRRLLYGVLTFFGITIAIFVLIHSVPGDPISFYVGSHGTRRIPQAMIAEMAALNPKLDAAAAQAEFDLVRGAVNRFELSSFREGHLTPVFFGSAIKNFKDGMKDETADHKS